MKLNTYTIAALSKAGFSAPEIDSLSRISRTLQRWHELECGTGNDKVTLSVERDESGKPFLRRQWMGNAGQWQDVRSPYPDKETGARKRLAAIMSAHPECRAYVQGDPRGSALYILRPGDVPEGGDLMQYYSRGVAV